MKKLLLFLILLNSTFISAQTKTAQPASDFETFLAWFPGEYENWEQANATSLKKSENPHIKIRTVVAKINFPQIGEHIYYFQQNKSDDPSKILAQNLIEVKYNVAKNQIETKFFNFPFASAFIDAHKNPSKLLSLSKRDLKPAIDCPILWVKSGNKFTASTAEPKCLVKDPQNNALLRIVKILELSATEFNFLENAFDAGGNLILGRMDNLLFNSTRIFYFKVNLKVKNEQTTISFDNFSLENTGKIYPLIKNEKDTLGFSVQVFAGNSAEDYNLKIFKKGETIPVYEIISGINSQKVSFKSKEIEAEIFPLRKD